MDTKEEATILLDYNSWLFEEADRGHNYNEIGDVIRRYENRMAAEKRRLRKPKIPKPNMDVLDWYGKSKRKED